MIVEDISPNMKIIVVGNGKVGKTTLTIKFVKNIYTSEYKKTLGVDFLRTKKYVKPIDREVEYFIWDTAGQEAFQAITRTYYKGAAGALLVYDITRRDTFTHVTKWLEEVKSNSSKSICIILIGNKKDLEDKRQVTYEEGENFAKENGLMFLETSAKTAYNVVEAFNLSAQAILNNMSKNGVDPNTVKSGVKLGLDTPNNQQGKNGCC